jgi:protein-tyrosine-phosphatase
VIVDIVCTGNVARSAALGILLADYRPDLDVRSSAVGRKAVDGRRCARPMRKLLADAGYAKQAEAHRSRVFDPAKRVDVVVASAAVHVRRLSELGVTAHVIALDPPLPDPAFGGEAAYAEVWPMIVEAAQKLAKELPCLLL